MDFHAEHVLTRYDYDAPRINGALVCGNGIEHTDELGEKRISINIPKSYGGEVFRPI